MTHPATHTLGSRIAAATFASLLLSGVGVAQAGSILGARTGATRAPRARSLSDIAGWIVLNNPAGSVNEPIVISDTNIDRTASRGVISQGGQAWRPDPKEAERRQAAEEAAQEARQQLIEQHQQQVQDLEKKIQDLDRWMADRHDGYPGQRSPHFQSPGYRDPNQAQRERLTAQLEQTRRNLDRARRGR